MCFGLVHIIRYRLVSEGYPVDSPTSMLFNHYIKPLKQIIHNLGAGCHQHADNIQIYILLS